MAVIENLGDIAKVKAMYRTLDQAGLISQQVALRATIHALKHLQSHPEETVPGMLAGLEEQLFAVHEVAHKRGIQLLGYS